MMSSERWDVMQLCMCVERSNKVCVQQELPKPPLKLHLLERANVLPLLGAKVLQKGLPGEDVGSNRAAGRAPLWPGRQPPCLHTLWMCSPGLLRQREHQLPILHTVQIEIT